MFILQKLSALNCFDFSILQEVLDHANNSDFIDLIDQILQDRNELERIAKLSYQHANGFLKIPILENNYFKVRLHYWSQNESAEENIHNHRWDMISKILFGQLNQFCFTKHDDDNEIDNVKNFGSFIYFKENNQGEANIKPFHFNLKKQSEEEIKKNTIYCLPFLKFHQVKNIGQCITFMIQSRAKSTENEMMVVKEYLEPNVKVQYISVKELEKKLNEIKILLQNQ